MSITIEIKCPISIVSPYPETKKDNGAQHYRRQRGRRCADGYQSTYRECLSWVVWMVNIMPVRGIGIRDISAILRISIAKVLQVHTSGNYATRPKQKRYDRLKIDGFWTYAGKKKNNNVRLMSAYRRGRGKSWRRTGGSTYGGSGTPSAKLDPYLSPCS
jgi:hypothetical protein